jgi:cardiolipin synthase
MTMGQDLPIKLVDELPANEFFHLEGRQFSKSDGWYIDLEDFLTRYSADQIRYTIAANAPETADSEFTWKDFQIKCNTDLLGKFGNFVHRSLVFLQNQLQGRYGRIAAIPLVVACLYWQEIPQHGEWLRWLALSIFIAAAVTDILDGYFARKWGELTSFGRMLDPIADKLLVASCLLMVVADGTVEGWWIWAAVIILCREILVSGLREFLAELRVRVPVSRVAKWKTTLQLVAIGFLIDRLDSIVGMLVAVSIVVPTRNRPAHAVACAETILATEGFIDLIVETFDHFTDKSGRADYYSTYSMNILAQ